MEPVAEDQLGTDGAEEEPSAFVPTTPPDSPSTTDTGMVDEADRAAASREAKARLEERRMSRSLSRLPSISSRQSSMVTQATRRSLMQRKSLRDLRTSGAVVSTADLAEEVLNSGGIIVDYLERLRGDHDPTTIRLIKVLNMQQIQDISGYEFASMMICREAMRLRLMQCIVQESKAKGLFTAVHASTFRYWGDRIRRFKREATCLDIEVHNLLMRKRLLSHHARESTETAFEKQGRLEEFWTTFHDRSRIVNKKPRDIVLPEEDVTAKYGMQWDFAAPGGPGFCWQVVCPVPGTLADMPLMRTPPATAPERNVSTAGSKGTRPESGLSSQTMGHRTSSLPSFPKEPAVKVAAKGTVGQGLPMVAERRVELPAIAKRRHRYLQECDQHKQVPTPLPFITGHSSSISAMKQRLVDTELRALAAMVQEMKQVREVDLTDNALLTDEGLSSFLQHLHRREVFRSLQKVSLNNCLRAGPLSLTAMTNLLQAATYLRTLDLSRVKVSMRFQLPLAQSVGMHPTLQTVSLAEIGLLPQDLTKECLSSILGSRTIRSLDLSWNCFHGEVFKLLGEHVVKNQTLQTLRVANCAASTDVGSASEFIPPLSLFLEQLSHNRSLTMLDIALNRCDFRTALILEDSLDSHQKLKELNLADNPLGVVGIRSILRLLCREHTGLLFFNTDGCYGGAVGNEGGMDPMTFSYTNPGGKYVLQLWRPYHRALLRTLYKMMEGLGLQPGEAFENISYRIGYTTRPWNHPVKDGIGVWLVPQEGDLTLTFTVEKAIFKRFMQVGDKTTDDSDGSGFLVRYYKEMRFKPSFKKLIPLFARWAELDENWLGQTVFLEALSKDFSLTLPYLEHICRTCPVMSSEAIMRLTPSIEDDVATQYLASRLFPKLMELLTTHQAMMRHLTFNAANPTGHYRLNLSNSADFAVAERLLLLDRWEAAVDVKRERKDVSQTGNGSHLRNEMYQGRTLHLEYTSVAEWKLPENGDFECDFISNQRPPKGAQVLSDGVWERFLTVMHASICTPEDNIAVLRSLSHTIWIKSSQMRSMIGHFKTKQQRGDVLSTYYLRVVDLYNAKIFRVRFASQEEVVGLQDRLGYVSCFPFFQPENARFELDLSIHDQRLCASMWVQLAIKEKFPQNLHDYGYRRPDGTEDPMALGVPKSWGDFTAIPKEGVFRGVYMCAPEFRNFSHRKDIAATYGFFNGLEDVMPETVRWWTGLTEPPEDVISLLEFFISRFNNADGPFKLIDGADGNNVLTLREFVDGLDAMGCHKFNPKKGQSHGVGRTKEQRIEAIFRYLDPGTEGTVTREEWKVLQQLWNEFDLCIREFVHFLVLAFGDDLLDAWEEIDTGGAGELVEEEWSTGIEKIGYFGPARVVFALLDSSDDGRISFDEFEKLERYKPPKYVDLGGNSRAV